MFIYLETTNVSKHKWERCNKRNVCRFRKEKRYREITFICGGTNFRGFVGMLIHEIKNPTNNETYEGKKLIKQSGLFILGY